MIMNGKLKVGLVVCTLLSSVSAVSVVALNSDNFGGAPIIGAKAEDKTFTYDASKVTTRRIYFVNNAKNGNTWYNAWGSGYEAQVYSGGTYSGFVDVHEIYGNYYYYADFSSDVPGFLGGSLTFELHPKGTSAYCHVDGIPALGSKEFDVVYIDNGNPVIGLTVDVGNNTGIIASVLDHYSTCAKSYSNGFYGYPQLYADFIEPNATAIANYGDGTMCEENSVSINTKIAKLQQMYNNEGWK